MNLQKFLVIIGILLILGVFVLVFLIYFDKTKVLSDSIKNNFNSEYRYDKGKDYRYAIDNKYMISDENISNDMNSINKWNSLDSKNATGDNEKLKQIIMEKLLNQNLFISDAIDKGLLDTDEFNQYIWLNIRDSIVTYYLKNEAIKQNQDFFKSQINTEQVDKLFNSYKQQYAALGLSDDQIKENIKQTILREEIEKKIGQFEQDRLSKLKLEKKIKVKE